MKFNTYYINLEKDTERNETMIKELEKTNLTYTRFQGIDGNTINKQKYVDEKIISKFGKTICTNKTIGCGLSHILLYKHIQTHDKNDYALILEDDVIVTNPELNYQTEINSIIEKYNVLNPTWEIIRLHSIGFDMGSAAAQIINVKYIDKFVNTQLHYHIDIQQSFIHHIINLNILFNTRDYKIIYEVPLNNVFFDNQKLGFYLNNHAFQFFDTVVYFYHIVFFLIIVMLYSLIRRFLFPSKRQNKVQTDIGV